MDNLSQERRTAFAIMLSILVIVVYNELFIPKPAPQESKPVAVTDTQAAPETKTAPPPPPPVSSSSTASTTTTQAQVSQTVSAHIPTRAEYEASETIVIETDLYKATITKLGGRVKSFLLKNYTHALKDDSPLEIITAEDNSLPLGVYVAGTHDAGVMYSIPDKGITAGAIVTKSSYAPAPGGELSIVLQGTLPNGSTIKKALRFTQSRYTFDVTVTLDPASPDGSPVWLEWTSFMDPEDESESWDPKQFTSLEENADIYRVTPDNLDTPTKELSTRWTAFGGSYFQAVLLNQELGLNTALGKFGNTMFIRSRGTPSGGSFSLFVGPKNRSLLREYGKDLHRTVDLGWFAFVGDPVLHGIHLLYGLLGNYGLAIVALTLLLKTALLPLTKTSFKSMKAMQDLQPEIKALRERVKDPGQLNQEVMGLYQKRGVNPLGGCFPMVLQMPIFLGMYNALQRDIDLRHAPFALWVNDLSAPEGLEILGISVPVMIILMGASMLFQQMTTPTAADPAQKKAMYAVPVIFTIMFILFPFPSGLVLYWLTNNVISIVQQMALRSEEGANPLRATILGSVVVFIVAFLLTLF